MMNIMNKLTKEGINRHGLTWLTGLVFLLLAPVAQAASPDKFCQPREGVKLHQVKVTEVVDGDSLKLQRGEFRIIGINAREHGERMAIAAKRKMQELLASGKIYMEVGTEKRDRHKRQLGHLWIKPADAKSSAKGADAKGADAKRADVKSADAKSADAKSGAKGADAKSADAKSGATWRPEKMRSVSEEMLREGMAFQVVVLPNKEYADCYAKAEQYALDNDKGVWPRLKLLDARRPILQTGFQFVTGKVVEVIGKGRAGTELVLEGKNFGVWVPRAGYQNFGGLDKVKALQGKEVIVRGWLYKRRDNDRVQVEAGHPAVLQVKGRSQG